MFEFEPLTDEQIEKRKVFIVAQPCKFLITNSYDDISKSSNKPMKVLDVRLTDIQGSTRDVKVYLSNTNWPLIKQFLASINKPDLYKTGRLPDEYLLGQEGDAMAIEESYVNKKGENAISIKVNEFLPASPKSPFEDKNSELNDDIPF